MTFCGPTATPRPLNFYETFKCRSKAAAKFDYGLRLRDALRQDPESETLLNLLKDPDSRLILRVAIDKETNALDVQSKKRKRQAHVAFHAQLDSALDGNFHYEIGKTVTDSVADNENDMTSMGSMKNISNEEAWRR
ncbi:9669_t:CDS:2 [Paraglomus brasilianum]|uniref:9669_t:CDS:1 n=1 Tax=Paraglomus brasilianum TaxID=144538 RepID=A0A9N9CI80_9GLOM|nr:9669_t:CDS:2 [Paraglomus brasilianum]